MTDQSENQVITSDGQPAYDPPQALRMGDIHAGAGQIQCENPGSSDLAGACRSTGPSANTDCSTGDGALISCTSDGNSAGNADD
jgi:hypothetical protein